MDDELDVVVATTAFGMGIDKPGTRFVVHAEPADSVDSYYQEIGRAGRDGEPALAVLVYRQEDLGMRRFFAAGTPAEEELQQVAGLVAAAAAAGIEEGVDVKDLREETGRAATPLTRDLNLLEQVSAVVLDEDGAAHPADNAPAPGEAAAAARELAEHHERVDQSRVEMMRGYAETTECRRQFLLGYFGEQLDEPCGNCDTCSAGTAQQHPGPHDHDTPFPVETPVEHSEWGAGRGHAGRGRPRRRPLRRGRLQDARARRRHRARSAPTSRTARPVTHDAGAAEPTDPLAVERPRVGTPSPHRRDRPGQSESVARHPIGRHRQSPVARGVSRHRTAGTMADALQEDTMAATAGNTGTGARTVRRLLALAFGAIYLLVGIVGFFVTGFDNFFGQHAHETLLFFEINRAHNIVHILIGVAGLVLARTLAGARTYGWLLAVGYGAAFIYGLFAVGEDWDFLNINGADNVLHLATALVGLVIALMPVRTAVSDHTLTTLIDRRSAGRAGFRRPSGTAGPGSLRLPARRGAEHTDAQRRGRRGQARTRPGPRGVRDGRRPGPALPGRRPRARRPRPGGPAQRPQDAQRRSGTPTAWLAARPLPPLLGARHCCCPPRVTLGVSAMLLILASPLAVACWLLRPTATTDRPSRPDTTP